MDVLDTTARRTRSSATGLFHNAVVMRAIPKLSGFRLLNRTRVESYQEGRLARGR